MTRPLFVIVTLLASTSGALRADSAPSTRPTAEDYARHVERLRGRVSDEFTFVVLPPFVVIGDEPAAMVHRRATGTVGWAVAKLKAAYFDRDPDHILDV